MAYVAVHLHALEISAKHGADYIIILQHSEADKENQQNELLLPT
jgi:hypothetical protein